MKTALSLAAFALSLAAPALAAAQEVSVASAYDRLYGTQYARQGGLAAMRATLAARTRTTYTLREMRYVDVLAYDTSGADPLTLVVGGRAIVLYEPGGWTPPSRGWRPAGRTIDLAVALAQHGVDPRRARFSLAMGAVFTAQNTHTFPARGGEFVLAHNGGGVDHEDADANEPLLRCRPGVGGGAPVAVEPARVAPGPFPPPPRPRVAPHLRVLLRPAWAE